MSVAVGGRVWVTVGLGSELVLSFDIFGLICPVHI